MAVCLLGLVAAPSGCSLMGGRHGDDPARPAFQGVEMDVSLGVVETTMPDRIQTESIVVAARHVLERRGYTIREAWATSDQGHVKAKAPDEGSTIRLNVKRRSDRAEMVVRAGYLGGEDFALLISGEILGRLGFRAETVRTASVDDESGDD